MEQFVALLRHVRQQRRDVSLVSPVKREHLELARGYFVSQWMGAGSRNRDLWRVVQAMQNRAPFTDVLPLGVAEAAEYSWNGHVAMGLGAAHTMDGLLVSLLVDPVWDTSWIDATCDELGETGDIETSSVTVRHAASERHAESHDAWVQSAGLDGFATGAEIWDACVDVYPRLQFLPRVRADLYELPPHWVTSVAIRLRTLNDAIAGWVPETGPEPAWKTEVTPEGVIRKRLCWFEDLDGERRLFDLHARFRPHQGRIHLRLVPEERKARIAYIGLKLGI
jgi:hypothetical protein